MERVLFRQGSAFTIFCLKLADGSYPVVDFILSLEEFEAGRVIRLIDQVKEYGPPRNVQKSRAIAGETNLFELKSSRVRILYFYAGEGVMVLTNGFLKNAAPPFENAINRAKRYRQEYQKIYQQ